MNTRSIQVGLVSFVFAICRDVFHRIQRYGCTISPAHGAFYDDSTQSAFKYFTLVIVGDRIFQISKRKEWFVRSGRNETLVMYLLCGIRFVTIDVAVFGIQQF